MALLANRFESTLEYALSFLATLAMTMAVAEKADAQTFDETLLEIENRWAEATYQATGREKGEALEALLNDVRDFAERHSDRAEEEQLTGEGAPAPGHRHDAAPVGWVRS